jgi:hypothetical protein
LVVDSKENISRQMQNRAISKISPWRGRSGIWPPFRTAQMSITKNDHMIKEEWEKDREPIASFPVHSEDFQ